MAAQKGKNLLLKIDSDGNGTFLTVAGLRTRQISLNAEIVDVTDSESAGRWREVLSGAGVKTANISGSGIFKDLSSDEIVRDSFFQGEIKTWQVVVPDFGAIEGAFQITSIEYAGEHDGEVSYELALGSAGELTFAPV